MVEVELEQQRHHHQLPPTPPRQAATTILHEASSDELRARELEEEMTTPRATAPVDVRVAVVEDASYAANGNSKGNSNGNGAVPYQTVEEYEGNPDAQKPGVGNGIQISLDGLGAVIPVGRNNQNRADEKAAASVRRDVEEGTSAVGKVSGGANGKNKVLLSEVRYSFHLLRFIFCFFSFLFSPPRIREDEPPLAPAAITHLSHVPSLSHTHR